jgi:hypothetical protein
LKASFEFLIDGSALPRFLSEIINRNIPFFPLSYSMGRFF